MPTTRSEASRSRTGTTTDATTIASKDWSLATPTETTSTSATRSTLTKRTPPPSLGGDQSDITVPMAGTSTQRVDTECPPSAEEEIGKSVREVDTRKSVREVDTRKCVREDDTRRSVREDDTRKSVHEDDTHSRTSARRKRAVEIESRMQLARRELEVAQAKLKLAQAEFNGANSEDEEEYQRTQEVEEWLIRTEERIETGHRREKKPTPAIQSKTDIQELASAIAMLARNPEPGRHTELPPFNGTCEEWLAFKRTYEDTAASMSSTQNLARLRRAVQGRAREAVQSLLFTAEHPKEVMAGLEARFGRPGALALAELEKMKNLPKIGENPGDICISASRVRNSVATIKALKKPQYLSSPETMKAIIEKMPSSMKFRWYAYYSARKEEDLPELMLIDNFLALEAEVCGDFAPPEATWKPHRPAATHEWEQRRPMKRPVNVVQEPTNRRLACQICEDNHQIFDCGKFKNASVNEKWDIVKKAKLCFKCLRSRHSRMNCKAPTCKKCGRWHHVALHSEEPPTAVNKEAKKSCYAIEHRDEEEVEEKIASVHTISDEGRAYLKMAQVDLYGPKGQARVLALLDEGSTVTLLDAEVAEKIGAEGKKEVLMIETVGGQAIQKNSSQKMSLKIRGIHRKDKRPIVVRTMDDLKLSEQGISRELLERCSHLDGIKSQLIYAKERPKLLIGQDNWGLIVTRRIKKGPAADPVASLTSLGWVLHGHETGVNAVVNFINHCTTTTDEVEDLIKKHFELESLGIQAKLPKKDHDRRALEILEKTTTKLSNGQYETGLLWKTDEETLPKNYSQALRRLAAVERKLEQNQELKTSYEDQMKNLIIKGYAEEAPDTPESDRRFYLPHFAVEHPVKKKARIVFDAAAKHEGKSLNDALLSGPDLLQSLFGVLVRFREGPFAVMADIEEMFLRIKIREADRDSLRFLWRSEDRKQKPKEYRMTSVIFGATSSPATAIFVMNKNAEAYEVSHPAAVEAIKRNHYMDDYLQSFNSIEEAKKIAKEVSAIQETAGFKLKGWASNEVEIMKDFDERNEKSSLDITKEEKTLGLRWILKEDALAFNLGLRSTPEDVQSGKRVPTKREVTSAVMSTFDPMGLATPVLIQGKKLIQDIWRSKIGWDDKILDDQTYAWAKYVREVMDLVKLKIPRCISPDAREGQLHTFTDASEEAYAAAVYWRTTGPDGTTRVTLVAGKARVTPTKPVSIPRLELQAALLGSRLAASIEKETTLKITKKVFWTDSSTVIQWVKSDPRKFKTFVAHRLAEIEEITKPQEWRWVPTKQNPADDATRGTPNDFDATSRWFQGPAFLRLQEEDWPTRRFKGDEDVKLELKNTQQVATIRAAETETPMLERFSSWTLLLHTMARVFQAISIMRRRIQRVHAAKDVDWKKQRKVKRPKETNQLKNVERKVFVPYDEEHLRKAELYLLQRSQQESFKMDINCIRKGKKLPNSSRLKKIDVYIGSDGTLKLRSRTKKCILYEIRSNPIVLDGKHKLAELIIKDYHEKFLHGNTATVMNEIRQRYWMLGLRAAVKAIIHRCQWCRLRKSTPQIPPPGDLPMERLQHHQPPFSHAAVDYFGPMQVTVGRRNEKRWGALFTCLTTRAVHLELVPSLSTSSMIMALRRMAARRGTPKIIFSDNGTNFVGASRELEQAALERGIRWKFIPPGSPNMGGAWERLVRSVKTALAAVLAERSPPEETLYTLMTEVEHIVNSRPLTHLSLDPDDEESLTPNHFLIGRSCGAPALGEFSDRELVGRANWKTVQILSDHFWRRWIREYLPTLMPRTITGRDNTDPREGDIVLIVDGTLPRNTWPRGKVIKTYEGPDGKIRIMDIKTSGGILRRPTRRVIVLVPAGSSLREDGALRTAGENVSDDLPPPGR